MRTHWELTLRGRMLATLASLATCGAWMTGDPQACLGAALLLTPLLIDVLWRLGGLPPMQLEVRPRRCHAGAVFEESVRLQNASRRGAVRDLHLMEPDTNTRSGGVQIQALQPGDTVSVSLAGRVWKRGRFARRGFAGETCYPLGLLRNRVWFDRPIELLVEPSRAVLPVAALAAADESAHATAARPIGREEFYALRDYRLGEDARSVHALRSAATGTLVAKELRGDQARHTCLVVDLRRPPGHIAVATDRAFEWGMSAAATLVDELPPLCRSAVAFIVDERGAHPYTLDAGAAGDAALAHLADARPTAHRGLSADDLDRLRSFEACLWIAAAGFAAHDEREAIGLVRLVEKRRRR